MKEVIIFYPKVNKKLATKGAMVPLSILSLANTTKENYNVRLIDGNIIADYKQLTDRIIDSPLAIGISSMTGYQITDGLFFAKLMRAKFPQTPIIWGGVHPTLLTKQTLAHPLVDIIIRGQGEVTFKELIDTLAKTKDLKKVSGIAYQKNGETIITPERDLETFNSFKTLPFELLDMEKYIKDIWYVNSRTMAYISSIGCPFDCTFCTDKIIYKQKWSAYPAERVLSELEFLKERYAINGVVFYDNNFFVSKKRVLEICRGIKERNLKTKWFACGRAPNLSNYSDEEWQLLKDGGCTRISIGAESGSQEILDLLHKQAEVKDTVNFLKKCKQFDIQAEPSLMIGFPDAPENDFSETIKLMDIIFKINPKNVCLLYFYTPYPGSELYDKAIKKGFIPPDSFERWGNFMLREGHTPWLDKKFVERGKFLMNFVIPFSFFQDIKKLYQNRPLTYFIKHNLALLRWKAKFFDLRLENWASKIIQSIKKL